MNWWACPNTPPCPHGGALHDVEDLEDQSPTCCVEGCTCGARPEWGEVDGPACWVLAPGGGGHCGLEVDHEGDHDYTIWEPLEQTGDVDA